MRLSGERVLQREQQREKVLTCEVYDMARDGVSRKAPVKDSGFLRDLLEKSRFWSAIM